MAGAVSLLTAASTGTSPPTPAEIFTALALFDAVRGSLLLLHPTVHVSDGLFPVRSAAPLLPRLRAVRPSARIVVSSHHTHSAT
eukprot:9387418-Pyramimonas_sp.AAC.2